MSDTRSPTHRPTQGRAYVFALLLIAVAALAVALYAVMVAPDTGDRGPAGQNGQNGQQGPQGPAGKPGTAGAGVQPGTAVLSPGSGGCPVGTQALDPASFVVDNHGKRFEVCQIVGAG